MLLFENNIAENTVKTMKPLFVVLREDIAAYDHV